ncbi:MAG: hypothetical protein QXX07_00090 [Candidatus Aenigmatarchaeota archaeon]
MSIRNPCTEFCAYDGPSGWDAKSCWIKICIESGIEPMPECCNYIEGCSPCCIKGQFGAECEVDADCPTDGWYCSGSVKEYRDYYCGSVSGNCECKYSTSSREDCSAKSSYNTGDVGDQPTVPGGCYDYTGCSAGNCIGSQLNEYCSGNSVYEYYANGASCSGYWKNCEDYESLYCNSGDGDIYRNEWQCSGYPGYCNDGAPDTKIYDCSNNCSDSDGGRSYFIRGTVTDNNLCSSGQTSCSVITKTDECRSSTVLREYFCSGNDYSYEDKDCTTLGSGYTCSNGKCVETIPPTTTITPNGHAWTNQDVSFTLTCTDTGSGCANTYYKIINDGESCGTGFSTGTSGIVTCPSNSVCKKRVCYYSIDNSDNVESIKVSNIFYIDKEPPSTPLPSVSPSGWTNVNSFNFSWSVPSDGSGSGISGYYWHTNNNPDAWTTSTSLPQGSYAYQEGVNVFYIKAKDIAGNEGPYGSVNYYYDSVPPTLIKSHSPFRPITNQQVLFEANASDSSSGLSWIKIYVDGQEVKTCTYSGEKTPQTCRYIGGPYSYGLHTYYAEAKDIAGNYIRIPATETNTFDVTACGNGTVETVYGEECELPNTQNNNYCTNPSNHCESTPGKYCIYSDLYGNCNENCICVPDTPTCNCYWGGDGEGETYCNAQCDSDDDCLPRLSGDYCYYNRKCLDNCVCSEGDKVFCPQTVPYFDPNTNTCYYGDYRGCNQNGCTLATCKPGQGEACTQHGCTGAIDFDLKVGVEKLNSTVDQTFFIKVYVKNIGNYEDNYKFKLSTTPNVQAKLYDTEIRNVKPKSLVTNTIQAKVLSQTQHAEINITVSSTSLPSRNKTVVVEIKAEKANLSDLNTFSVILLLLISLSVLTKNILSQE